MDVSLPSRVTLDFFSSANAMQRCVACSRPAATSTGARARETVTCRVRLAEDEGAERERDRVETRVAPEVDPVTAYVHASRW